MITWLKEVGRGKRGARDLTYEEARQAAEWILERTASDAQIGAFLMAERIKMESEEELLAFTHALRERSRRHSLPGSLLCSGPYDGRNRTFMAGFASAFVLAACGLPVSLHGSPSLPPKHGVTLPDVLRVLGIELAALPPERVIAAAESGILIVPTEAWCPPLAGLRPIREEIGMRTLLNSAEKLMNVSNSPYVAFGVFHNTVFDRMARLLVRIGVRRGIIIQGMEGSEDITVDRPTRTLLVKDGAPEMLLIQPDRYELDAELPEIDWTAEQQAWTTEEVLRGTAELPCRSLTLINSAVRLYVAERAASVEEGVYLAKHALDSGDALGVYERWRSLLRDGTGAAGD